MKLFVQKHHCPQLYWLSINQSTDDEKERNRFIIPCFFLPEPFGEAKSIFEVKLKAKIYIYIVILFRWLYGNFIFWYVLDI